MVIEWFVIKGADRDPSEKPISNPFFFTADPLLPRSGHYPRTIRETGSDETSQLTHAQCQPGGAQANPTKLEGLRFTARERRCLPMVCADSARVDATCPLSASTHTSHEFCHGRPAGATISPKRLDPSERVTNTVSPTASCDTREGQSSASWRAGLGDG